MSTKRTSADGRSGEMHVLSIASAASSRIPANSCSQQLALKLVNRVFTVSPVTQIIINHLLPGSVTEPAGWAASDPVRFLIIVNNMCNRSTL